MTHSFVVLQYFSRWWRVRQSIVAISAHNDSSLSLGLVRFHCVFRFEIIDFESIFFASHHRLVDADDFRLIKVTATANENTNARALLSSTVVDTRTSILTCFAHRNMFKGHYFPISNVINRQSMSKSSAHTRMCYRARCDADSSAENESDSLHRVCIMTYRRTLSLVSYTVGQTLRKLFMARLFAHHSLERHRSNERMTSNHSAACDIASAGVQISGVFYFCGNEPKQQQKMPSVRPAYGIRVSEHGGTSRTHWRWLQTKSEINLFQQLVKRTISFDCFQKRFALNWDQQPRDGQRHECILKFSIRS